MHTPAAGLDPASQEIGPATEHLGERLEAGQYPFRDTKVRVLVPESDFGLCSDTGKLRDTPLEASRRRLRPQGLH